MKMNNLPRHQPDAEVDYNDTSHRITRHLGDGVEPTCVALEIRVAEGGGVRRRRGPGGGCSHLCPVIAALQSPSCVTLNRISASAAVRRSAADAESVASCRHHHYTVLFSTE